LFRLVADTLDGSLGLGQLGLEFFGINSHQQLARLDVVADVGPDSHHLTRQFAGHIGCPRRYQGAGYLYRGRYLTPGGGYNLHSHLIAGPGAGTATGGTQGQKTRQHEG
jgi:hypothetical protein